MNRASPYFLRKLSALRFGGEIAHIRSKRQRRPPTVLTQEEVGRVLRNMEGTHRLMGQLLYGCGLRLMECIRLRVQDIDWGQGRVFVRGGKGGKDRTVVLPTTIHEALAGHVERVRDLHEADARSESGVALRLPPHSKFLQLCDASAGERGNIRMVQELLGHANVEMTMIYTHVVREMGTKPQSPLDL